MIKDHLQNLYDQLPSAVKLVAVSKFHPVERLREAYDAGQRIFAESRPQEFAAKVPQLPSDIEWHFIGHLQTNKLKLVLPYVSLVQSVDSLHLLEAIDQWGRAHGRVTDVLLELHLGAEETKQGFSEEEIMAVLGDRFLDSGFASARNDKNPVISTNVDGGIPVIPTNVDGGIPVISTKVDGGIPVISTNVDGGIPVIPTNADGGIPVISTKAEGRVEKSYVRIRGLMGMATNTEDEAVIEGDFARIEALFQRIRDAHPELAETFTELSIGMSADWPIAVRHGATMVRIGTDIFGPREY